MVFNGFHIWTFGQDCFSLSMVFTGEPLPLIEWFCGSPLASMVIQWFTKEAWVVIRHNLWQKEGQVLSDISANDILGMISAQWMEVAVFVRKLGTFEFPNFQPLEGAHQKWGPAYLPAQKKRANLNLFMWNILLCSCPRKEWQRICPEKIISWDIFSTGITRAFRI